MAVDIVIESEDADRIYCGTQESYADFVSISLDIVFCLGRNSDKTNKNENISATLFITAYTQ